MQKNGPSRALDSWDVSLQSSKISGACMMKSTTMCDYNAPLKDLETNKVSGIGFFLVALHDVKWCILPAGDMWGSRALWSPGWQDRQHQWAHAALLLHPGTLSLGPHALLTFFLLLTKVGTCWDEPGPQNQAALWADSSPPSWSSDSGQVNLALALSASFAQRGDKSGYKE